MSKLTTLIKSSDAESLSQLLKSGTITILQICYVLPDIISINIICSSMLDYLISIGFNNTNNYNNIHNVLSYNFLLYNKYDQARKVVICMDKHNIKILLMNIIEDISNDYLQFINLFNGLSVIYHNIVDNFNLDDICSLNTKYDVNYTYIKNDIILFLTHKIILRNINDLNFNLHNNSSSKNNLLLIAIQNDNKLLIDLLKGDDNNLLIDTVDKLTSPDFYMSLFQENV